MRRWIALGVAGLGVAWGPYVYSELTRHPIVREASTLPLTAAGLSPAPSSVQAPSQRWLAVEVAAPQAPKLAADSPPTAANKPASEAEPSEAPPTAADLPASNAAKPAATDVSAASAAKPLTAAEGALASAAKPLTAADGSESSAKTQPSAAAKPEPEAPVVIGARNATPEAKADAPHAEPEVRAALPDLAPAFSKAFAAELRDEAWASDEEPRLTSLLQGAGLPDGAISEVACRKSVCRVSFTNVAFDTETEAKLSARIAEEFGRGVSLDLHGADDKERAPLYVLRAGYELEAAR